MKYNYRVGEQINGWWVLGSGVVNMAMKCYRNGTIKYLDYGGYTKLYM